MSCALSSAIPPACVWHKETSLGDADAVIVPGGFSYGDYLRTRRHRAVQPGHAGRAAISPPTADWCLASATAFRFSAKPACCPARLIRNRSLQFRCEHVFLKTVTADSPFTNQIPADKFLRVPIAHGEGCYFADETTLAKLKANNQILWQYVTPRANPPNSANPNGSLDEHRRHLQRTPQRRRAHAASRTRQRSHSRQRRWPLDFRKHDSRACRTRSTAKAA